MDHDPLALTTLRCRLVSEPQLERGGYSLREARKYAASGLLISTHVYASVPPRIVQPLACWSPGEPEPNYASLAYQAKKRGRSPVRRIKVYVASKKAGNAFGGRGGPLSNPFQADHDLSLTNVFLLFAREHPDLALRWFGEDALPARGKKGVRVPDAMILDARGNPACAVEFVGASYSKERIASFYRDCTSRNLPFVLW